MSAHQRVAGLDPPVAGTAALAEDASTGFYNPAGLTNIDANGQLVASVVGAFADSKLTATQATNNAGANILARRFIS